MTLSQPLTADGLFTLYDKDYYLWLEMIAQLLRDRHLDALDAAHLMEEIEDMGRSEKRAVYSNLKILLMHLLKEQYQPENRSNSWAASIVEHRQRLKKALKESPSLQPYVAEVVQECYQDARELAAAEMGLNMACFAVEMPFTLEAMLNADDVPSKDDRAV